MSRAKRLSRATVLRMELYLEYLEMLQREGRVHVTSSELGRDLGVAAANVRQDLFGLGSAGRPKVGYDIAHLVRMIRELFDLDRQKSACIVGFGNLGRALAGSTIWARGGYRLAAIFDNDPEVIGTNADDLIVKGIDELKETLESENIEMAVVTVPAAAAQETANLLVAAGIRAIWNFTPVKLHTPSSVAVENQSLSWGLITLSHRTRAILGHSE